MELHAERLGSSSRYNNPVEHGSIIILYYSVEILTPLLTLATWIVTWGMGGQKVYGDLLVNLRLDHIDH